MTTDDKETIDDGEIIDAFVRSGAFSVSGNQVHCDKVEDTDLRAELLQSVRAVLAVLSTRVVGGHADRALDAAAYVGSAITYVDTIVTRERISYADVDINPDRHLSDCRKFTLRDARDAARSAAMALRRAWDILDPVTPSLSGVSPVARRTVAYESQMNQDRTVWAVRVHKHVDSIDEDEHQRRDWFDAGWEAGYARGNTASDPSHVSDPKTERLLERLLDAAFRQLQPDTGEHNEEWQFQRQALTSAFKRVLASSVSPPVDAPSAT